MGIVFSALIVSTSISRAAVIVDNLSYGGNGSEYSGSVSSYAQVFTMPGGPPAPAYLDKLEVNLTLDVQPGNVNFYLYTTTSGGVPTGSGTLLGTSPTLSSGPNQNVMISLVNSPSLSSGTSYAIVMTENAGVVAWDATSTSGAGSGTGTLPSGGGIYTYNGTAWTSAYSGYSFQMDVETGMTPVPEVPTTGAFMGFGALTIAVGHSLRRKLFAAKNFSL